MGGSIVLWIWQDGWLREASSLPPTRAFTHGMGVFETMLAIDGRLVSPERHWRRLGEGCQRLGLSLPESGILEKAAALAGPGRQRVRLQVSDAGLVTVNLADAGPIPGGVAVRVAPWTCNERSPVAGIKCCSYAANLVALEWVRQQGGDEVLFGNSRNELCEAAMANVFLVEDGVLVTPPLASGCLPGTARERLLELRPDAREEVVPMARLAGATELFLSSATKGVVPVTRIDGRELEVGATTRRVREDFAVRWFGARTDLPRA